MGLFDHLIATDDGKSSQPVNDEPKDENEPEEDVSAEKRIRKNKKKRFVDAEFGVVRGVDFKNVRTVKFSYADYQLFCCPVENFSCTSQRVKFVVLRHSVFTALKVPRTSPYSLTPFGPKSLG